MIVAAALVRLWTLSKRGSLWLDEASLALNVLGRGYGGLAAPLDWGQAAPVGFLWILKTLTLLLGPSEWVLRFWPFVAGVAVVALTWEAGRRLVGAHGALLATIAMATSLLAIRYSAEAKPYASDAAIALGLVVLAHHVLAGIEDKERWRTLRLAGVVAVLVSLPSAFVLGAIGIALFIATRKAGKWPRLAVLAAGTEWLTTFVIMWFVVVRAASGGAYLKEYWAPVMLDVSAPDFIARFIRMFASVASTPLRWDGELTPAAVAMLAALCGLVALARRAPLHAILLAGPTALGAAASFVGLYPMSDRLAFFAAPLMILVSAKCVAGILSLAASRGGPRGVTVTTVVAGAALALWIGSDAWRMVRDPGALEPTRGLFEKIRADAKSAGTPVYVFSRAAPAWLYATSDWSAPANPRHAFYRRSTGDVNHVAHENFSRPAPVSSGAGDSLAVPGALPAELIGLATGVRYRVAGAMSRDGVAPGWAEEEARRILAVANPDVWIVASHFFEGTPRDELRPLIAALRAAGAVVAEEIRGGRDALALRIVEPPPPQVPTRR